MERESIAKGEEKGKTFLQKKYIQQQKQYPTHTHTHTTLNWFSFGFSIFYAYFP